MPLEENLPKQDLLAKLLKMTTSANDSEALVAIRKANALLSSAGWDWDKLIAGKIRVAADPFANLGNPADMFARAPQPKAPAPPRAQAPRPAAPPPRPAPPPPPPRPQPAPKPFEPRSHQTTNGQSNRFPGNCYCCGYNVSTGDGKLFTPSTFNGRAPAGKKVICDKCDQDQYAFVADRPAPQPKTSGAYNGPIPSAKDL